MTLAEQRADWETTLTVKLVLTKTISGYSTVYVLLQHQDYDLYFVHRYFQTIPDHWVVSVDHSRADLETCLEYLDDEFRELYPKTEP